MQEYKIDNFKKIFVPIRDGQMSILSSYPLGSHPNEGESLNPIAMQGWRICPAFLFFEFLKFGFLYHNESVRDNKAFKIPSDGY